MSYIDFINGSPLKNFDINDKNLTFKDLCEAKDKYINWYIENNIYGLSKYMPSHNYNYAEHSKEENDEMDKKVKEWLEANKNYDKEFDKILTIINKIRIIKSGLKNISVLYHTEKYGELQELEKINIGDFIDLRAAEDVDMEIGEFKYIPLGVSIKLPKNYYAMLVPRSSTFKNYGIIQPNSPGIIDESYCGFDDEWKMPAYALRECHIKKGDRICQFSIIHKEPFNLETTTELSDKGRDGFGSTGKN